MRDDRTYMLDGLLSLRDDGDSEDVLFCGEIIVAQWADEECGLRRGSADRAQVSLRYWTTDKPVTKDEAQRGAIEQLSGEAFADFEARYSEVTGYLWTDEHFKVGGHDMIARFFGIAGKYLFLELTVHAQRRSGES